MRTILVTGGAGYIGSVLVRLLLSQRYKVRVVDNLMYGGESLTGILGQKNLEFIKGDLRDARTMQSAVKGVFAVAHLAAIVGDPACALNPELAKSVNLEASTKLYQLAASAGVKKFIFASTCSNYGKTENNLAYVNEQSPLKPLSLYAETKVAFENYLLGSFGLNRCQPVCLRFATAYGVSPRMRFDLTVNDFIKQISLGRELYVHGKQLWRPYCHVIDLAQSVIQVLAARITKLNDMVFNVGDTAENYQKQMIVRLINEQIPLARVKYVDKEEDPRDYKVNFDKIKRALHYKVSKKIADGIKEIHYYLQNGFFFDPDEDRYSNAAVQLGLKHSRKRIEMESDIFSTTKGDFH